MDQKPREDDLDKPLTLGNALGFITEHRFNYAEPEKAEAARDLMAALMGVRYKPIRPYLANVYPVDGGGPSVKEILDASDLPDLDIPVDEEGL